MNKILSWIEGNPGKATLIGIAFIVAFPFAALEFRARTAGFVGSRIAESTIESAASRIANYEHFYDLCASIEGYEDQLETLEAQLESTDPDDSREVNRLRSSIAGLEGQRARAISQYNADSSKDYTAARFKASDLPWSLSTEKETVCNASYNS